MRQMTKGGAAGKGNILTGDVRDCSLEIEESRGSDNLKRKTELLSSKTDQS